MRRGKNPGLSGCLDEDGEDFKVAVPVKPPLELTFVSTEEDLSMYAVIKSGGKQYRVKAGQTIRLEKLAGEVGSKVQLGDVLMVEDGGEVKTGAPLPNAKVEATILESDRADKVIVFKKKRKKQYRRTNGHRQGFTAVRIEKITV
jgi:large subunit ribosomal protein L21